MKSSILSPTDGFDLIVNNEIRSFRDDAKIAISSAFFLKQQNPTARVQIRTRADGSVLTVLENGTLG